MDLPALPGPVMIISSPGRTSKVGPRRATVSAVAHAPGPVPDPRLPGIVPEHLSDGPPSLPRRGALDGRPTARTDPGPSPASPGQLRNGFTRLTESITLD